MTKRLILLFTLILMAVALIWVAQTKVGHNLQEEMRVSADLRRENVALREENKVYEEIFNCFTLKNELGLIEEDTNG